MFKYLALAAGVKAADWAGTNVNVTNSWPASENSDRTAGGIISFDSPAGQIANFTGSCTVSIATSNVNFVHFFNAHVGISAAAGEYTISASGAQDAGSYTFLVFADDEPVDADVSVACQNDAAVTGPVFDSFPQDPFASSATASFSWRGDLGGDTVAFDFGAGNAPNNFTMHDPRLAVEQTGDVFTVSNMGAVNYEDVGFSFEYADGRISAYDITLAVV